MAQQGYFQEEMRARDMNISLNGYLVFLKYLFIGFDGKREDE